MNSGTLARSLARSLRGEGDDHTEKEERGEGLATTTSRKEGGKERMRMQAKDIMHANGNSRREAVPLRPPSAAPTQLQYLQCGVLPHGVFTGASSGWGRDAAA